MGVSRVPGAEGSQRGCGVSRTHATTWPSLRWMTHTSYEVVIRKIWRNMTLLFDMGPDRADLGFKCISIWKHTKVTTHPRTIMTTIAQAHNHRRHHDHPHNQKTASGGQRDQTQPQKHQAEQPVAMVQDPPIKSPQPSEPIMANDQISKDTRALVTWPTAATIIAALFVGSVPWYLANRQDSQNATAQLAGIQTSLNMLNDQVKTANGKLDTLNSITSGDHQAILDLTSRVDHINK